MAEIRFERGIAPWGTLITFNAPKVRNALNRATVEALLEVFQAPGEGSVVLASDGPVFSGGGDLAELRELIQEGALDRLGDSIDLFNALVAAIASSPRPTIAAVGGIAAGGGMALALACDVRIATRRAALLPAYLNVGSTPDGGTTLLLGRALGQATAKAALLTGKPIEAASPWGALVFHEVVDDGALMPRAAQLAQELAGLSRFAVSATKQLLEAASGEQLVAQLEREREAMLADAKSGQFLPRVRRFLERGSPASAGDG